MRIFSFAASLFLGMVVAVTTASAAPRTMGLQTEAILSEQAQIRAGVDARKGAYKELPAGTRERLLSGQARVLQLIEGKQSTDELDDAAKVELFAVLDSIDAMVSKANDERLVCQQVKTIGSNRKERVCRTVGQMRADREAARHHLDNAGLQGARGG